MGLKEKLILFLIHGNPGIRSVYGLVRHLDKANFPSELGKSIDKLLSDKLTYVSSNLDNGTASEYGITEEGKEYLKKEFNREEILIYIDTFHNPTLTRLYVERNS